MSRCKCKTCKCKTCQKKRRLRSVQLRIIKDDFQMKRQPESLYPWTECVHPLFWHVNGSKPRIELNKESRRGHLLLMKEERIRNPPGLQMPLP
jgi:hypothetical protein